MQLGAESLPVPLLGHGNWPVWSIKIRAFLNFLDLWKAVEPQEGVNVSPLDEQKALSVLILHLEDSLVLIFGADPSCTAQKLWGKLEQCYARLNHEPWCRSIAQQKQGGKPGCLQQG